MAFRRCRPAVAASALLACLVVGVSVESFSYQLVHSKQSVASATATATATATRTRLFSTSHLPEPEDTAASCTPQNQRRRWLVSSAATVILLGTMMCFSSSIQHANAAPPIAIIAEELGYFPVTNRQGETVYVPKRVSRSSSDQAIALAKHLEKSGVVMYGAYWCPHCARQKELLGSEAWKYIRYVECAPKGYGYNAADNTLCNDVTGFPTWQFPSPTTTGGRGGERREISGEVPLSVLAQASEFPKEFREELETNVPARLGSAACKQ